MERYTAALEARMQELGYDTFRRTDENGIEQICFLFPVNDDGDEVFMQLSVFGGKKYYFCMEFYSIVGGSFGDNLSALEKATGLWNGEAFGAYAIDDARQYLYHRQFNILDAQDSPGQAARLATYVLTVVGEEINSRLPEVLDYIELREEPGDAGDLPLPPGGVAE